MSNNERTGDQPKEGQPQQPATEKKSEKTINKRLQRTQAQVNEVVDIMRVNIEKVLERDKNLSQLDDRADALQAGASQFEASAGKLKRKFWWRNCKLLLVLCGILAVIAIVIIVAVTSERRETGSVNVSGPINSTSLSPNLSSIEEDGEESQEGPQQHLFNLDSGESPDETQHKEELVHGGSRTNRVFPHGEEAIPSFPSAPTHQKPQPTAAVTFSPLTKLHLSPEIQEEGNLEENSLTIP
ncbi:unnamed protein product [Hymenolepis diminuta]|uniref:V-SNARE coiled-coil homology domain-containing protein n=1 Tax=Hymenolepis diminuta TaxID=6216 RepID=A0A564ZB39_HYMDI|nr:unnamed protein product [Hymenolepis diminuta]